MTTKVKALLSLRPGAEWLLLGDELQWLDQTQTKPTEAELQAELDRLIAEQPRKIAQQQRSAAYTAESDPLFFKAQAGEVDQAEWLAKREEIRARFPYPTEVTA